MESYSLAEIRTRQTEVLEQAAIEPVLLTEEAQPSGISSTSNRFLA